MFPLNFLYLDKLMVMFRNIVRTSPWNSTLFIRDAYRKCLKVIDSCENDYHLQATSNYLNNFLRLQSEDLGGGNFETDEYVINAYRRLRERFTTKKRKIQNDV